MGEDLLCVHDDSISTGSMTLRKKVIAETHDGITSIHLGENRTYYEIRRRVYWPSIAKHVHDYTRTCQACQKNKIDRQSPQGLLNSLQQPTRSGTHYSMDFVTHLPMSSRGDVADQEPPARSCHRRRLRARSCRRCRREGGTNKATWKKKSQSLSRSWSGV
jgi:hypothetical protein